MSGRVLSFEGNLHRQVERLLPWFANQTLDEAERIAVQRHLDECAPCRRALDAEHAWVSYFAGESAAPADPASAEGWHRLRARLAVASRSGATAAAGPAPRGWHHAPPWMRWALAAQLAAIVVLAAAPWPDARRAGAYHTLSAPATEAGSANRLLVEFDAAISQAQVSTLLRAHQARIVDGPNDAGAYVIDAGQGRAGALRAALRGASGVVMVEPLAPRSSP